jgi:hypothetical protein
MGGNEGADWWRVSLLKERVAQLVEHLTFNQEVMGSNPIALTNEINMLDEKHRTKHSAEINQGNTWGNATNRRAARTVAANWPRSHARELEAAGR